MFNGSNVHILQDPHEATVQVRIDVLQIVQRNRFRQQLLVEWKSETAIKVMPVKYCNTNYPTDKVKVRKMFLHITKSAS